MRTAPAVMILLLVVSHFAPARAECVLPLQRQELRVRKLVAQHLLQEAAWELQKQGRSDEARRMTDGLEWLMRHDPVTGKAHIQGSTAFEIVLQSGVRGVWKPFSEQGEREIACSNLDRLFDFGMVPLTVERTLNGVPGSLQYFVRDLEASKAGPPFSPELLFFDYVTDQDDRDMNPPGRKIDGSEILYDNGDGFKNCALDKLGLGIHFLIFYYRQDLRPRDLVLPPAREAAVNSVSDRDIREVLGGRLYPRRIEAAVRRRDYYFDRLRFLRSDQSP
jgi:hypothetical protein